MSDSNYSNSAQTQLRTSDSNMHCMIEEPCVFQALMELKQ